MVKGLNFVEKPVYDIFLAPVIRWAGSISTFIFHPKQTLEM